MDYLSSPLKMIQQIRVSLEHRIERRKTSRKDIGRLIKLTPGERRHTCLKTLGVDPEFWRWCSFRSLIVKLLEGGCMAGGG